MIGMPLPIVEYTVCIRDEECAIAIASLSLAAPVILIQAGLDRCNYPVEMAASAPDAAPGGIYCMHLVLLC